MTDKSINVSLYCLACLLALFTLARIACLLRFWVNKPFLLFYLRHAQIKNKALRGSLPKSVPLDFGLDKTFALFFIINTTIYPNNEIAVRMRKLSILLPFLYKFKMLFHRFFNDRLKVPSVVKPLTIYTDLEAYCFFLLFEYHLGIIFLPE